MYQRINQNSRDCVRLRRHVESAIHSVGKRAPMNQIPHAGSLVRRCDFIRRIDETGTEFLVTFSGHAARYYTTSTALQQTIRVAHAAKREVSFSADRHCELFSVVMHAPRSIGRRIADRLERLTDIITGRSTRCWRDKPQAAQKAK